MEIIESKVPAVKVEVSETVVNVPSLPSMGLPKRMGLKFPESGEFTLKAVHAMNPDCSLKVLQGRMDVMIAKGGVRKLGYGLYFITDYAIVSECMKGSKEAKSRNLSLERIKKNSPQIITRGRPRMEMVFPESGKFTPRDIIAMNPDCHTRAIRARITLMKFSGGVEKLDHGIYRIVDSNIVNKLKSGNVKPYKSTAAKRPNCVNSQVGVFYVDEVPMELPDINVFTFAMFSAANPQLSDRHLNKRLNIMVGNGSIQRVGAGVYNIINRQLAYNTCQRATPNTSILSNVKNWFKSLF